MNVKQLLALAYITPDESTEVDTPIGTVGYALAGTTVVSVRTVPRDRAEDGADVFVHQHDTASEARECYSLMVNGLRDAVGSDVMSEFADALARVAYPGDMFTV